MTHPASGHGTDAVFTAQRARVTSEDELRDAIPYLLGFSPERSLVILGLDKNDVILVSARLDTTTEVATMRTAMSQVADVLHRADATHALVLYMDDVDPVEAEGPIIRATAFMAAARHLSDMRDLEPVLVGALNDAGLPATFCWPEPADLMRSTVRVPPDAALIGVTSGRAVLRRRGDLAALLEPIDGESRTDTASAARDLESVGIDRLTTTDAVLGVLQRCASARRTERPGAVLCPAEVAACAVALSDLGIRDVVVSMLGSDRELICDDMWLQVVRQAPERLVAGPATVLGVGAYLRGDGAFAACAFERALRADPDYRLARMMHRSLTNGIPPTEIRGFLSAIAADMMDLLSG